LVALLGKEVIGWAEFRLGSEEWFFEPIAVLKEFRKMGIGICLLLESMLGMKTLGHPTSQRVGLPCAST
jgi:hypothetical protein